MKTISSIQNTFIKDLFKLQEKSRERKKRGLFVIEGLREINLALQGNYSIEYLLYQTDLVSETAVASLEIPPSKHVIITKEIYQKLAYRDTTEGIIAVVKTMDFNVEHLKFNTKYPLVLVLEGIEKPGNIGAILRTADAANVDAVLIANPKTDLYNPNVIRSSVGCVFTNQIAIGNSEEICTFLEANKIAIYSATLQNSNSYYKNDFSKATALVVGTEATGLTQLWRERATQNIIIPMQGAIDSMNVSVAAAILTFEAKRQRDFSS